MGSLLRVCPVNLYYYYCVWLFLSDIVTTSLEKRNQLVALLFIVSKMYVDRRSLFNFSLSVIVLWL